jgi:hypothetical protein
MAKVSVVWTIFVLVLFLVALVMFFVNNGELENQKKRVETLTAQVAEKSAKNTADSAEIIAISERVGYQGNGNRTDVPTLSKAFDDLKKEVPEYVDSSVKTIQSAIPLLVTAVKSQKERATDLDNQVKAKAAENDELQKSMRTTVADKDKEIADLRRQVTDLEGSNSDLKQGYEKQVADLREQLKASNVTLGEARSTNEANLRKFQNESEAASTRMSEMGRKLNPIVKEPQSADGHVLAVSKNLGLGWIDLGAKNRLPVGARFTVVSGSQGSSRVKAMAEVTRVQGEMAEVAFTDQRDPYDPPTTGDVVFNPVYDPHGERNALLVGGFSGKYGEDQLKNLLAGMGIHVQTKLDSSTDIMIVGSEMYQDPETRQPVETPIQPTDLPVFKEAVAQGVQVVQLKDLRGYFRF